MPSEPDHRLPHSPAFAEDTLIAHLYALRPQTGWKALSRHGHATTCDAQAECAVIRARWARGEPRSAARRKVAIVAQPEGPSAGAPVSNGSAGCGAHVGGAVTPPTRVGLALELHALALVQLVESSTVDAGGVEEQLLAALVLDEAEAPISYKALDRAGCRHTALSLLPPTKVR